MASRDKKWLGKIWKRIEPLVTLIANIFSHKWMIALVSVFAGVLVVVLISYATYGNALPVLQTHGVIADKERDLIYLTVLLGVVVVVPVFFLLFYIAWKYRAGNKKAIYDPEYDGNKGLEILWWGIPGLIIVALGIITFISTHALDPYKELESDKAPLRVQVISLQWKWLFIYPDLNVASVQELVIPEDTPINFELTSDAPMNSFWIPALSGQIYTMTGMSTKLHIMADEPGEYNGSSANISGEGFSDMNFKVIAKSDVDFAAWKLTAEATQTPLDTTMYNELAKPSKNLEPKTYKLMNPDLYNEVIMKYMDSGVEK